VGERLTDEQLRTWIRACPLDEDSILRDTLTELLALRAKLLMFGNAMNEWRDHPVVRMITKEIARL
jgi:hypothetical protein